jgi:hypothetical protein
MKSLRDFAGSVTIVVSSCDAFFDVWRPFVFFFRNQWPTCPLPVFLIANELQFESAMLKPLHVGPDRGWATTLRLALEKIAAPYVLYMQEDYFLTAPVDETALARDFAAMMELDADSLCFRARTHVERDFQPLNDRFGIVPVESDGRTRAQVTLWKRASLLRVLRDGESGWEMEREGSPRTRDMQILSYGRRDNSPIRYLMSAIVRSLWTTEALALCKQQGVRISPHFRGTYSSNSLIRGYRRWRTRDAGKRALAQQRQLTLQLDP